MKKPHIPAWLRRLLYLSARHRYYPLVVASIAFVSTTTFAFPFVMVLIPAVLIAPRRWLVLGLLCGISSGIGAAVLVEVFNYFGSELVLSRFPELVESERWQFASDWLKSYGLFALMIIAGSPIPQTPALFFYSLVNPSVPGVLIAVGIGKTVKYVFLAWATTRYPARFFDYR
ncbi:YqaA family protein [Propionivibrio sp.]|uniref:YqaA family protein n=1 Tax=Propionivibrio sp. TaxID=2212460 RepID=UPI003BF108E5